MRPFLLLASRPEDEAADDEYAAFLRATGLDEPQLRRIRLEAAPLPPPRALSVCTRVVRIRAPLAPIGWPKAIAPP